MPLLSGTLSRICEAKRKLMSCREDSTRAGLSNIASNQSKRAQRTAQRHAPEPTNDTNCDLRLCTHPSRAYSILDTVPDSSAV